MTLDDFIKNSKSVHNNKYDYSNITTIKPVKEKVPIICSEHGIFQQNIYSHLNGHGCPKCKGEKHSKKARYTLEQFIEKANVKHNNKFDYSLITEYTGNKSYYDIICPIHGVFSQRADKHLRGQNGCKACNGKGITTEDFIKRANIVHSNKYTYPNTVYTKMYDKLAIKCNKHGEFIQRAHDHLNGNGCPLCGEEIMRKAYLHEPTILYLLYLTDYDIYKIGITVTRHGIKSRYLHDKGLNYTVIREIYFLDGAYAYITEKQILKKYKITQKYNILRGGNTELIKPKKEESVEDFITCIDTIIHSNIRPRLTDSDSKPDKGT